MNVFFNIKDNIQEYLYRMNDYSLDKLFSMMRKEIESMGIIDGAEIMHWKTPDKMFEFEIERVGNSFIPNLSCPQYTNIIRIKNNLGIQIHELRFSEFECLNILSAIAEFCQCHFDNSDTSVILEANNKNIQQYSNIVDQTYIHINPSSTIVNDPMIHLEFSKSNPRLCKVTFLIYNLPPNQMLIELLHFVLDYDTLVEMCFVIFFQCIIDLDLDNFCYNGYGDDLYKVEDFVYGGTQPQTTDIHPTIQNQISQVPVVMNQQIIPNTQSTTTVVPKLDTSTKYKLGSKLELHKMKKGDQ